MWGVVSWTISPSVRSTSRSTPWVLGCWGPMLTSISSVRTSNSMTVGSATDMNALGDAEQAYSQMYPARQSLVPLEAELRSADHLVRCNGRADVFFDVLDDQPGPLEVADVGLHLRVVHRVRQVADEGDVLAILGHLPQAERPAEDAHVRVDADQQDVGDAAGLQQIP